MLSTEEAQNTVVTSLTKSGSDTFNQQIGEEVLTEN